MEVFKTSAILFGLCLFQNTLTETQIMCKGNLPPVKYVAPNSNVTVPCPDLTPASEMDFKLYKGSDVVTFIYINNTTNNTLVCKQNDSLKGDFPAYLDVNLTVTRFVLFGVAMNVTDLYTCEAVKNYPPPFVKVELTPQTIVFVEDTPGKQLCQHVNYLVLWVVLGGMIIYGLVMTYMILKLRIKLNQKDSRLYGFKNMKLRECRQKWQGVQHPTWQGFYINPKHEAD